MAVHLINLKNPPKTCPPERSEGGSWFRQNNYTKDTINYFFQIGPIPASHNILLKAGI